MRTPYFCIVGILFGVLIECRALQSLFPRQYMAPCGSGWGVCMTTAECGLQRGHSVGSCSLGTCCRIERSCGQVTSTNNTYFVNPDNVAPGSSCSLQIEKKWTPGGVCQMRLDFVQFQTIGPNFGTGRCSIDALEISGADHPVPIICGQNDNQHIYVDVRHSSSLHLTMSVGLNVTSRHWKIRVTQIPCYSERLAPAGCLQYFEHNSGNISSFNYGNMANDSSYPLNLNYEICFRGACTLEFSRMGAFGMGEKNNNAQPVRTVNDLNQYSLDDACFNPRYPDQNDKKSYLLIDDIRFCSNQFLQTYTTRNPVRSISFVSTAREYGMRGDLANAPYEGFRFSYRQICG